MEPPGGSVLTQEAGTVWSEMSKYHEAHEEHEGKKYFFKIRCSFPLSDLRVLRSLRGE
jgi:hypothetical protein